MLKISFANCVIKDDMAYIRSHFPDIEHFYGSSFLITGGTGMIASYVVAFLLWLNEVDNANINIYVVARNKTKALERYSDFLMCPNLFFLHSDISEPLSFDFRVDYIIHAASLASPQFYGLYPVETILPNVVGTNHLLDYCRRNKVKGFLFLSSGSVYGTVENKPVIDESVVGTLDFLADGNCYGVSKRCGEALCKAYFREFNIPTFCARIHHTYGPTMDYANDSRVFSEFVKNVLKGENIEIKGDGKDKRAFCYLSDTVTALFRVMLSGNPGESYNVGNPDTYISIKELAMTLRSISRDGVEIVFKNHSDDYVPSPERRTIPLSIEKMNEIGWRPSIGVKQGFEKTISAILEC